MRKVDDGEEKKRKEEENNVVFNGHYVIASRPPERRATGTPHARANVASMATECTVLNLLYMYIIYDQY